MDVTQVIEFEAPVLSPPTPRPPGKLDQELAAYQSLLPGLLAAGHRGQYVAVHDGQVVGTGPDKVALALDAYRRFGKVAVLVREVNDRPTRVVSIPSVRVTRRTG